MHLSCHLSLILTLNTLNCFKDFQRCIPIHIISWILFNHRRPNAQWSNPICCLIIDFQVNCSNWGISLVKLPWCLIDDRSTLVQMMAWCHVATNHYLSQCWPRSVSLYGITRPQRVITKYKQYQYISGLLQNCSNSIANAMELLQSCTKPLIRFLYDIDVFLLLYFQVHSIYKHPSIGNSINIIVIKLIILDKGVSYGNTPLKCQNISWQCLLMALHH